MFRSERERERETFFSIQNTLLFFVHHSLGFQSFRVFWDRFLSLSLCLSLSCLSLFINSLCFSPTFCDAENEDEEEIAALEGMKSTSAARLRRELSKKSSSSSSSPSSSSSSKKKNDFKESLPRVAKEEEEEEDARRNFDETAVSYGIFNSPGFEGKRKLRFVRELFDRIATNYDFMNAWISLGGTSYWRLRALRKLHLRLHGKVLDVGCGSGMSTQRILRRYKGICVECEGLDPSKEMISVANAKNRDARAKFTIGNIENCDKTYKTDAFDAVVTVYTLRNFADSQLAIWQMMRVLKPGGKLVVVDAFPPKIWPAKIILKFWLEYVMPIVAFLFIREKKDRKAYKYLSKSIQYAKYTPETFVHALGNMGGINMNVKKYMFGVCCRIECEKNFVKRDEHDPLKRYKRDEEDLKPYYEPVEWMDMIFPILICIALSAAFSNWLMSLDLKI